MQRNPNWEKNRNETINRLDGRVRIKGEGTVFYVNAVDYIAQLALLYNRQKEPGVDSAAWVPFSSLEVV